MMSRNSNPWAGRFAELLDSESIRQRAVVRVPPLANLYDMPVELSCKLLSNALEEIFYPTQQCVSVLSRLAGMAHAHCTTTYSGPKEFLGGVYASKAPLPDFHFPVCLTGLAGIGKSKLLKAFNRILGEDQSIIVDSQHPAFPLQGAWSVSVHARSSPKDVLRALTGFDDRAGELVETCRKMAFRNGIPLLIVDEFQFATGSENANARVTQMLLSLGYVGIPYLFAANFSLLRRLQRRPEEEQQRLLSEPIILLPDLWSSEDWKKTLEAQMEVAPEVLRFDPVRDARSLHGFTAGRKRAMAKLILLAFREGHSRRQVVSLAALEQAFHSTQYARYREEVEIIAKQSILNRPDKSRLDLWCPIPLPRNTAAEFTEEAIASREAVVAELELKSALTSGERNALLGFEKVVARKGSRKANVVQLKKERKSTGMELLENAAIFRENLTK
jgi:energy-coupling factor transporter ATP-binding protein EcfA2